jgi:hypothetical protein
MKYRTISRGRYGGPVFSTLREARAELRNSRKSDVAACRRRFGVAQSNSTRDSYRVTFGINLYSSSAIVPA